MPVRLRFDQIGVQDRILMPDSQCQVVAQLEQQVRIEVFLVGRSVAPVNEGPVVIVVSDRQMRIIRRLPANIDARRAIREAGQEQAHTGEVTLNEPRRNPGHCVLCSHQMLLARLLLQIGNCKIFGVECRFLAGSELFEIDFASV